MDVATETARMNGWRTMPKVPGLNAQPLGPSIGTDHHRLSARERVRRNGSLRQARPISGRGHAELLRTNKPHRSQRTVERIDRTGTAKFAGPMSYATALASVGR